MSVALGKEPHRGTAFAEYRSSFESNR